MKVVINILGLLALIVTLTTCEKEEKDTEKPVVLILRPSQSSKINIDSTFIVKIDATDNIGIEKVELLIDGDLKDSDMNMPYEIEVEKSTLYLGMHTLLAKAYDPSDNVGLSGIINIEITGYPPSADFTASETTITVGESIQFTDQSSNNPTSWSWDFGDGTSSTSQNPSHTYSNPGIYNVILTVTNNYGSDSETKASYITVGSPPVADFTASETTITVGESIQFTDQSSNDPTSWSWDFGDGGSSTQQNPSHNYNIAGSYTVSLTVSNAYGEDTEIKDNYITASSPDWPRDTETEVVEVSNPVTGKTWMDRNLGASRVATSSTDADAYGDLYQWGRAADGHEKRNSATTSTLSVTDIPGHGNFITVGTSPNDWRSPQNDNLWQGVDGINNPCPRGYRLPTEAEWEDERQSWSSNNSAGAFASPLKLPLAGYRGGSNGLLGDVGSSGGYWSSTVGGVFSRDLYFSSGSASLGSFTRSSGDAVRCLKD